MLPRRQDAQYPQLGSGVIPPAAAVLGVSAVSSHAWGFAAAWVTPFGASPLPDPAEASAGRPGVRGGSPGAGPCPWVAGICVALVGVGAVLPSARALPDSEISSQNGDSNS